MSERCPNCGTVIEAGTDTLTRMHAWCEASGVRLDFEDAIPTADAERLLGLAPGVLRNWRCMGTGPDYIRRGGRCRYRLADLANFFCDEA
ncbi:hypothetical protein ACKVEX_15185 [Rhodocyclaceae bacterium SMB388]